jgi:hypothetical protein
LATFEHEQKLETNLNIMTRSFTEQLRVCLRCSAPLLSVAQYHMGKTESPFVKSQ